MNITGLTLFLASLTSLTCCIKVGKPTISNEEFRALFLAGLVCKFSNENKDLCVCFCPVFVSQVVVSTLDWTGVSKFQRISVLWDVQGLTSGQVH